MSDTLHEIDKTMKDRLDPKDMYDYKPNRQEAWKILEDLLKDQMHYNRKNMNLAIAETLNRLGIYE